MPGEANFVICACYVTGTTELFLTEPADVALYDLLFDRLRKEALPGSQSLDLITETAARLADQ